MFQPNKKEKLHLSGVSLNLCLLKLQIRSLLFHFQGFYVVSRSVQNKDRVRVGWGLL